MQIQLISTADEGPPSNDALAVIRVNGMCLVFPLSRLSLGPCMDRNLIMRPNSLHRMVRIRTV